MTIGRRRIEKLGTVLIFPQPDARKIRTVPNFSGTALFFALWLLGATPATADTVNRIIAIVNDDVITQADVSSGVDTLLEGQEVSNATDASRVHQAVLQHLIQQRLILQAARQLGILVDEADVLKRLDALRQQAGSEQALDRALADAHISQEQLKDKILEQLLIQRMVDVKVRSTITVSPQEVAREVGSHPELNTPGDRVRARHILIRVTDARPESEARSHIEELRRRLERGEDFAELAKRYSEDPHADEGGLMDWVAQGELLPELDKAVFALKPGELSAPIQTRLGFHLLTVLERRSTNDLSATEAHRAVYHRLFEEKFEAAFRRWLDELTQRAYIEIVQPTTS